MIQSGCAPDSAISESVLLLKGKICKEQCGRSGLNCLLFWGVERLCYTLSKNIAWVKI